MLRVSKARHFTSPTFSSSLTISRNSSNKSYFQQNSILQHKSFNQRNDDVFKNTTKYYYSTMETTKQYTDISLDAHDAIVIGVWSDPKNNVFTLTQQSCDLLANSTNANEHKDTIENALRSAGISGKQAGETRVLYGVGSLKRVGIICLGKRKEEEKENDEQSKEKRSEAKEGEEEEKEYISLSNTLRTSVQSLLKSLKATKAQSVLFPERLSGKDDHQLPVAEGAELSTWKFDQFKSKKNTQNDEKNENDESNGTDEDQPLNITVAKETKQWNIGKIRAAAQNTARYLAETPSNHMTPEIFCESADQLFSNISNNNNNNNNNNEIIQVIKRDEKWIQDQNMGALMAVNRGSDTPMRFLEIHYQPIADRPTDLMMVGKGVTFDSGGISIKPSANMGLMRGDMGGAAAVVGALHGIASLEIPMNVSVVAPLCENMPDARSYKPGDVITARNGKHIEIDNTDAEGRLILADALHYAQEKWKPKYMIDVATLTGAMLVALGNVYSGVFSSSDKFWEYFDRAGRMTNDLMWRMPMHNDYFKLLKSDIADFRNAGSRGAGACSAAMFLNEFVDKKQTEWAHLDIAGTGMIGSRMTGRPTRALIQMAQLLAEENQKQ